MLCCCSGLRPAFTALVTLVLAVVAGPTWAQTPPSIDSQGNLISMPFELDLPVVRSTVERQGESLAFVHVSSMAYEEAVDHYRQHYYRFTEFAPGWTLIGFGYDVGAACWVFTLRYASQIYRIEVRPDEVSGGSIITVAGRASMLAYRPTLPTIAPYRAQDVGPIEVEY